MKYFRYIVRHNGKTSLHIIGKALQDMRRHTHIQAIILRVFVDDTGYNDFREGEICWIGNPIKLHERSYRPMSNRAGRLYEKRMKGLVSLYSGVAIS